MKIDKIFNNNIVLVKNEDSENIILGKGIAFGKKVGDNIENNKIEKIFILEKKDDFDKFNKLLDNMPSEYLIITNEIIEYAKLKTNSKFNNYIYLTLTDHINFAIKRAKDNIYYTNQLLWEIKKFYSQEYEVGLWAINLIKEKLNVDFKEEEAANIALHLVNAKMSTNADVSEIINMTKMIQDIMNIIKYHFKIELNEMTLSYERLITHLKFFFLRIKNSNQIHEEDDFIYQKVKSKYKKSYNCMIKIEKYLNNMYNISITNEEKTYLIVHIQRVVES